jgi:hypothetical protein
MRSVQKGKLPYISQQEEDQGKTGDEETLPEM